MTIPRFGRVTPIQMDMLFLVGYRISRREVTLEIPDTERLEHIRRGRERLKEATHKDFGYDLAMWHEFLTTNNDGYTHPYAFRGVKNAVENALSDPKRARLVSQLEKIDGH